MLRFTAIQSIHLYRKYLSPRKGYDCAYRVCHGGASCSHEVESIIRTYPVREWRWRAKAQFAECRSAYDQLLLSGKKKKCRKKRLKMDGGDILETSCMASDFISCLPRRVNPCDVDVCGFDIC